MILICSSPVTHGVDQLSMWKEEDTEGRGVPCGPWSSVDLDFVWWCERTDPQGARPSVQVQGSVSGRVWSGYCGLWDELAGPAGGSPPPPQGVLSCSVLCPQSVTTLPSCCRIRGPMTSLGTAWPYRPGSWYFYALRKQVEAMKCKSRTIELFVCLGFF